MCQQDTKAAKSCTNRCPKGYMCRTSLPYISVWAPVSVALSCLCVLLTHCLFYRLLLDLYNFVSQINFDLIWLRVYCAVRVDSLPHVEATILELLRYKTTAPFSMTHRTTKYTEVGGYFIPGRTTV